jgi:hypothetical protein
MSLQTVTRAGRDRTTKSRKSNSIDPDFQELLELIKGLSAREISEGSGELVGRSKTRPKTRRPCHYTMSGAAKALGLEYCLRKCRLKD